MQAPDMFNYLKDYLARKGIESKKYEEHLASLGTHDNLPCPICFTERESISKLIALPEKGGFEPVKCEVCKEVFHIPTP